MSPAAYRLRYAIMQHRSVTSHRALRNPGQAARAWASYEDFRDAHNECTQAEIDEAYDSIEGEP